jgi:hypothetical protein
LLYQCPHCGKELEIPTDKIDETVICPNPVCKRPFHLEVPTARQVRGAAEVRASHAGPAAQTPPDEIETTDTMESELAKVHPAMFRRRPFSWLGLALAAAAGVLGMIYAAATGGREWLVWLSALVAVAAAITFFVWWIRTLCTTLTVTNVRTSLRRGILKKETSEVRHRDVRNLQVQQNLLERMFGVGTLEVSSSGQDVMEVAVDGVPKPEELAELIRKHQAQ